MATWDRGRDLDDAITAAGPRLRALRRQRDITLDELSAQTGISKSTLSRLESGSRRPTLELLLPLARIYGVTLDELVGAPPTGDPRVHLRPVTRGGMTMLPLTRRAGGIQAFKIIMRADSRPGEPDLKTHEGYEWVYVLNGQLRLVLGEHDLVLRPGEAAEFDSPHAALVRPGRRRLRRVPQPVRQAGRAGAPARGTEERDRRCDRSERAAGVLHRAPASRSRAGSQVASHRAATTAPTSWAMPNTSSIAPIGVVMT